MPDDELPNPEKLPQEQPTRQEPRQAKWPGFREEKSK